MNIASVGLSSHNSALFFRLLPFYIFMSKLLHNCSFLFKNFVFLHGSRWRILLYQLPSTWLAGWRIFVYSEFYIWHLNIIYSIFSWSLHIGSYQSIKPFIISKNMKSTGCLNSECILWTSLFALNIFLPHLIFQDIFKDCCPQCEEPLQKLF